MFSDLNKKLSEKVGELDDRTSVAEDNIEILRSKVNYRNEVTDIKHIFVMRQIKKVLFPAIVDVTKIIATITRNHTSRKELETICNEAETALNELDYARDEAIGKTQHKYPLLTFGPK